MLLMLKQSSSNNSRSPLIPQLLSFLGKKQIHATFLKWNKNEQSLNIGRSILGKAKSASTLGDKYTGCVSNTTLHRHGLVVAEFIPVLVHELRVDDGAIDAVLSVETLADSRRIVTKSSV